MLWFKHCVLKWLLRTLPYEYIEDGFYRAIVLEQDELRKNEMWYMIYKLWHKHPINIHKRGTNK